jgi:hypothetical protein
LPVSFPTAGASQFCKSIKKGSNKKSSKNIKTGGGKK